MTEKLRDLKKGKRRKLNTGASYGEQYRSKRAGGDILRKDAPEPHAYIPLSAGYALSRGTGMRCCEIKAEGGGTPMSCTQSPGP